MSVIVRLDRGAFDRLLELQDDPQEFVVQLTAAVIGKAADLVVRKTVQGEIERALKEVAQKVIAEEIGGIDAADWRHPLVLSPALIEKARHMARSAADQAYGEIEDEIRSTIRAQTDRLRERYTQSILEHMYRLATTDVYRQIDRALPALRNSMGLGDADAPS